MTLSNKVSCFNNLISLDSDYFNYLINDCEHIFSCDTKTEGENYSVGSTYFVKGSDKPRFLLEHLALEIFCLHTKNLQFNPE
jgi:hypothetical protein